MFKHARALEYSVDNRRGRRGWTTCTATGIRIKLVTIMLLYQSLRMAQNKLHQANTVIALLDGDLVRVARRPKAKRINRYVGGWPIGLAGLAGNCIQCRPSLNDPLDLVGRVYFGTW